MTAMTHPFIDPKRVHAFAPKRREGPSIEDIRAALRHSSPSHAAPVLPDRKPRQPEKSRSFKLNIPLVAAACAIIAPTAAAFATIPASAVPSQTEQNIAKPASATHGLPQGNMLPHDYPGIYPGERIVYYFIAPNPGLETTRQEDANGCLWYVGANDAKMGLAYPVVADTGIQECSDDRQAQRPYRARMIGNALPHVNGAGIRIVDVIDAASGTSVLPRSGAAPAVAELPSYTLPTPPGLRSSERPTPADLARTSQPAPTPKPAARPAPPAQNMASASPDQMVSLSGAGENLVPITHNPHADDVMVPITGDPTPLRAIRPGEPMAAGRPLSARYGQENRPAGSPLDSAS